MPLLNLNVEVTDNDHCKSFRVGEVMPKKEAKAHVKFTPTLAGSTVLLVNFDSNKLKDIKSFINVKVLQEATAENSCMCSFL